MTAFPIGGQVPGSGHHTATGAWHPGSPSLCRKCRSNVPGTAVVDRELRPTQLELLLAADHGWRTVADLAGNYRTPPVSLAPLHVTASSLIRRGYLQRIKNNGVVRYRLTERGMTRRKQERRQ